MTNSKELATIEKSGKLPVYHNPDFEECKEVYIPLMKEETGLQLAMGAVAWNVYQMAGAGSLPAFAKAVEEHTKTVTNYAWVYGRLMELNEKNRDEIATMLLDGPLKYSHLRAASAEKDNRKFMKLMRTVHDQSKTVKWVMEQITVRQSQAKVPEAEPTDEDYNPLPPGIAGEVVHYGGSDPEPEDDPLDDAIQKMNTELGFGMLDASGKWLLSAEQVQDACASFAESHFKAAYDAADDNVQQRIRAALGTARASIDMALMVCYGSEVDVVTGEIIEDDSV